MASHLHLASAATAAPGAEAAAQKAPIRVVLAEDHALMRRGLRQLLDLEQNLEVVAEADDLTTASRLVRGKRPQVLVLDLGMPDGSSIEAIGSLRTAAPQTEIVVLSSEENPVVAQRTLAAGALGCVSKELADGELAQAIRSASHGERYVSPPLATRLEALRQGAGDRLTGREMEVLRLIALGHTSVEIARKLQLSPRTIETHRAHICKKLCVSTRAELVRYALNRHLIGA